MGCPKSFSVSGGMGAALLTKPDLIHDVNNLIHSRFFFFPSAECLQLISNFLFSFLSSDFDYIIAKPKYTGNL